MRKIATSTVCVLLMLTQFGTMPVRGQTDTQPTPLDVNSPVELVRSNEEYSSMRIIPATLDGKPGIALLFEGTEDMHYYAKSETAPAPGLQLKIQAESESLEFGSAVFPDWHMFTDAVGTKIEVYSGTFTVFVPIRNPDQIAQEANQQVDVTVTVAGIACTSMVCLPPFDKAFSVAVNLTNVKSWQPVSLGSTGQQSDAASDADKSKVSGPAGKADQTRQAILPYGTGVYLVLAVLAGISINIMPCVLPVIPLILMRLIDQSRKSEGSRLATGAAFCIGVILFFAAFALISAIINITTGAVLDLNSLFRYPTAVIVLFLAIVFFALVMLDLVPISLPASVAGRQNKKTGIIGTAGMGFFAGILSTPCSGALLGFVLVWAQTQTLLVSSTAFILMGVGMALPYAVVMSIPSLLDRIPKPGTWMDIVKKSAGFLLFLIAVKLTLTALPKQRLLNVLTFGIIFGFSAWMWGKWVSLATPKVKRRIVRAIAVAIAVLAGIWLLPAQKPPRIDWRDYDRGMVQQATAQQQPVLLKFTADLCTNCKIEDKRVYP